MLLVRRLLLAKKTRLWLERELKRLDKFGNRRPLGYVQQSRGRKSEVLFALLAHRYERRKCSFDQSNLVFSEWGASSKALTTAAAIIRWCITASFWN